MDLKESLYISGAGLKVQQKRLRVIAENIANADSTATVKGGEPYRRKTISFKNELDRKMGIEMVKVDRIGRDNSPFEKKYDPGNPVADEQGYVEVSNVSKMIESIDAKEAQRSYEANISVIDVTKTMLARTLDLLK